MDDRGEFQDSVSFDFREGRIEEDSSSVNWGSAQSSSTFDAADMIFKLGPVLGRGGFVRVTGATNFERALT
jgi:hypothetical protein